LSTSLKLSTGFTNPPYRRIKKKAHGLSLSNEARRDRTKREVPKRQLRGQG